MPKRPAPPPVEVTRETPSRSRRQASKEALKQMQLLLDDENDAVEIASDEDVSYVLFIKCFRITIYILNQSSKWTISSYAGKKNQYLQNVL